MVDNTARNPITNDRIASKVLSEQGKANMDLIDWSVKLQPANELLKDPIDGFNDTDK